MGNLKRPWLLQQRSNTLFIVSTVGIGMFTDLFLYGIIVPILPFILKDRVGIPKSEIQSYTSILLACFAGASVLFSMPAGIIADRLPTRQIPFLCGLTALLGATILFFIGENVAVLIIARILQGVSGATVWTIGLALIMDTVGPAKLGVTVGSVYSFISVGELAAPVLGGVVYKKAGRPGIFAMACSMLAVDFVMRLLVIEKKTAAKYYDDVDSCDQQAGDEDEEANNDDDEGSPLLRDGKQDPERWKINEDQPNWIRRLPILYILGDSRVLTAEAVAFTQAILLATFDATIPTEAQDLFGFDSLKAGLLFMPIVLPCLLLGPIFGKIVDRTGPRPSAVIGMAYLVPCLVCLRIPQVGCTAEIVKFCVIMAFCGAGIGSISAPSIVESSFVTEQYYKHNKEFFGEQGPYAQLYAINSMVFSLGLTIGPLVAGGLRDRIGFGNMTAVIASLCAVVSVLSFFFLGGKPKKLRS